MFLTKKHKNGSPRRRLSDGTDSSRLTIFDEDIITCVTIAMNRVP